jgi:hypothetical protein
MRGMGSRSCTELLQLPVRLHGIRLGQPVDLLLDQVAWRALGLVVRCGDETERFLAFAAAEPAEEEIVVGTALMLLEDVAFYRSRSRSLRSLLGTAVTLDGRGLGAIRDVLLAPDGAVEGLVVERKGRSRTLAPDGVELAAARAPAA